MYLYLTVLFVLFSSGWFTEAVAGEVPKFIKSQHQTTLQTYLNKHPEYQIAPDTLCNCEKDLEWLRAKEPDLQPYYAVGDINDDQVEDFAVALIDSRKARQSLQTIDVVIFHGPFFVGKANNGVLVLRGFKIERAQELLYVFKSRIENGFRLPARLDLGPGPIGSDDVQTIIFDKKLKKYRVSHFYDE